jgi:two-component system sensor histidine kinase and response regulator WspE
MSKTFDPFLLELLHAELGPHTNVLEAGLPGWKDGAGTDSLADLARAAHSLKGAARIVQLDLPAKLAGAMEDVLTAAKDGKRKLTAIDVERLLTGAGIFAGLAAVPAADVPKAAEEKAAAIEEAIAALGRPSEATKDETKGTSAVQGAAQPGAQSVPQPATHSSPQPVPAVDDFMLELFRSELSAHADVLHRGIAPTLCATADGAAFEAPMRAAHSLKGAARMVNLPLAAGLAGAVEDALGAAQSGKRPLTESAIETLRAASGILSGLGKVDVAAIPSTLAAQSAEIDRIIQALGDAPSQPQPAPANAAPPAASLPVTAAPVVASPPQVSAQPPSSPAKSPPAKESSVDPFLLDLFRAELENQARVLEAGLVRAEADQTAASIEPLMRAAHSIKGAARMVTLDIAVKLAHVMEDLLSAVQHGKRRLTSSDVDLLLSANDVFLRLTAVESGLVPAALEADAEAISAITQALTQAFTNPSPAPKAALEPSKAVDAAPAPQAVAAAAAASGAAKPAERADDGSVRVFVENLNRLTGLAGECLVEARSLKPLSAALYRIKQGQRVLGTTVGRIAELLEEGAVAEAQDKLQDALEQVERLDNQVPAHIAEFDRFGRKLELLTNRLYDESVASRMRPFSDALHGFSRMARDLARSLGKSVAFEIRGESTRVDRDILEKLEAPLTHLLRNAIDHGLELPEVRMAAGKAAEGQVILEARHVSGVLEIVLSDDGAGIDLEKLRAKVLERKYATAEMVENLSSAELLDFLFLPGFSTASKVTEISGRGVGLDIVQSMVREVGGNCRIETHLGRGSRFILQLPLTLSVVRTLLMEIGGQVYAAPLTRIDRLLRLAPSDLQMMENRQFCRHGDQTIGLVDAQQVLELPLELAKARPQSDALSVMVLSDFLNRYGLVVDRFLGQRDLAVIPLHPRLGKVPNLSAAAILEDGTPVLILDVDDLVRSLDNLLGQGSLRKLGRREQAARTGRKRILVVDDSLTVREVERRLLENRGYEVVLAVDGMDGWNKFQNGGFDLVVTDVDMPRMDGIELTRRLKSLNLGAALPIMIISYKDQEEYRNKGLEAGASYYLSKSSFQDEALVDAVRDLIGDPVAL